MSLRGVAGLVVQPGPEDGQRGGVDGGRERRGRVGRAERVRADQHRQLQLHLLLHALGLDYELPASLPSLVKNISKE